MINMFNPEKIYRHQNAKDLDIYVIQKIKETSNDVVLTVAFLLKSNHQIIKMEDVTISKNDFKYWSEIEN